jgi:hypothetical protein
MNADYYAGDSGSTGGGDDYDDGNHDDGDESDGGGLLPTEYNTYPHPWNDR